MIARGVEWVWFLAWDLVTVWREVRRRRQLRREFAAWLDAGRVLR